MNNTVKGFVGREPVHTLAADSASGYGMGSAWLATTAIYINVQECDASGSVIADHDVAGIAWKFPALGVAQSGDEVEVTYDGDNHIVAFRIINHI